MSFEFDTQIYEDRIYRLPPGILFLKAKTGILADPVTVDLTREKKMKNPIRRKMQVKIF